MRVGADRSAERRRHWTTIEKQRLVAETLKPGAKVSAVARQAGMHPNQLHDWRRKLGARAPTAGFAPVRIADVAPSGVAGPGTIEIELAAGGRIRISGAGDAATVTAAVAALAHRRRR